MEHKFYTLVCYAITGIALAVWPSIVKEYKLSGFGTTPPTLNTVSSRLLVSCFSIVGVICVLLITGQSIFSPFVLGLGFISIILSFIETKSLSRLCFTAGAALLVSSTLPWWQRVDHSLDLTGAQFFFHACITVLMCYIFKNRPHTFERSKFPISWVICFLLLALPLSFSLKLLFDDDLLLTSWHHWGAYIGPAELLLEGAIIFRDFPAQYGLGPTSLIAGFCGNDCWSATYLIAAATSFLSSALIAIIALTLAPPKATQRIVIILVSISCCYLWTAYPPSVGTTLATPSVSGLRFLPALILLSYLFFANDIEQFRKLTLLGHLLWAAGALWSPESAFYVTFLWWPYYVFVLRKYGNLKTVIGGFFKRIATLLLFGLGLGTLFILIYWLVYQTHPTIYGLLAYALNPPGPLPIDPHGNVWFFIFCIFIGAANLITIWFRSSDSIEFRRGFLIQLLCYSSFSYYLGRSHDNNILNILPFAMLLLCHTLFTSKLKSLACASVIMLAALLSWLPIFGWKIWSGSLKDPEVNVGKSQLLDSMSFTKSSTLKKIENRFAQNLNSIGSPQDVSVAIHHIRENFTNSITVIDQNMNLVRSTHGDAWSAIHGPANFVYIPSKQRRLFLTRTATTLKKSGWLIYDKKYPIEEWLNDYDTAYTRKSELDFKTYHAVEYVPK